MSTPTDSLDPVRDALLAAAQDDARRTLAQARDEADRLLRDADDQVAAIGARAVTEGKEAGRRQVGVALRRAHRDAQAAVLGARREAYDELRRRVRAKLQALREGPRDRALRGRLMQQVRTELGSSARIAEAAEGGIVATTEGRQMTLTFSALTDRALAALGSELEGLWTP